MRILIAPDKFKGTLTAGEAARAMMRGWRRSRPEDTLEAVPISDGGDGFGDVMRRCLDATPRRVRTVDAAHRPCLSTWWFQSDQNLAVIESARVIGLAMLPRGQFHPFELDTQGLGAALHAAARAGTRTCIVGIGGSATNDGGFGVARALGWQFLDHQRRPITQWPRLGQLAHLLPPEPNPLGDLKLIVATDVQNRLLGRMGATRVYGPQKGLRRTDFVLAEAALARLALVVRQQLRSRADLQPGSGAAGGLGFGLLAFAHARIESGFELFSRHSKLEQHIRRANLVVTGEGALDRSTLMGKGVGELARACRRLNRPCLALGGGLADRSALRRRFTEVHALTPDLTTRESAESKAALWLEELTSRVAATHPSSARSSSRHEPGGTCHRVQVENDT